MGELLEGLTPVTLLTGFLGSGKTTLLQRLLRDPALGDSAVLINELGEIGLDHHLLGRIDDTMVLLQSGCLCCTVRSELSAAIRDLLSKRDRGLTPPFRRLVIESTGLADPFPILSTLRADPVLVHHVALCNVVTTVDAVNGMFQLDRHPESVKQVAAADQLVVTKTDLAGAGTAAALLARLRRLNPLARLWRSAEHDLDATALLAPSGDCGASAAHDDGGAGENDHGVSEAGGSEGVGSEGGGSEDGMSVAGSRHDGDVRAVAFCFDGAVDWTMFGVWLTMLLHRHGDAVLRVKGILNVAGTEAPVAVHGVQRLVHTPTHMGAWPDGERRSRLVLIVKGLAPAVIGRSLRAFGLSAVSAAACDPPGGRRVAPPRPEIVVS